MKLVDRTGRRYGRLVVIARTTNDRWSGSRWLCVCDCGNEKIVHGNALQRGSIQSCGCLKADAKRGAKNPAWKGGKIEVNGYRQIKMPEHHRANNQGYVFEHVLIMEQMIGRPLTDGEVVHHRNLNRADNKPGNLALFMSKAEHTAYHKTHRSGGVTT